MFVGGKVSPPAIPLQYNPSIWLDATDAGSITVSGGRVTVWADKSGAGRNVTNGAASGPTTGTNTIGGKNALYFAGAQYLASASTTAFIGSTNQVYSAFMVCYTNGGVTVMLSLDNVSGNRMPQLFTAQGSSLYSARILPSVAQDFSAATITANTPFIPTAVLSTTYIEARINGVTNGSTALSGNTASLSSPLWVGDFQSGGNALVGAIGEVIIYPTVLTNAEINVIGNYLAAKWSISWTNL
jgi:hypothetical protein